MRARMGWLCLVLALCVGVAAGQEPSRVTDTADIYCSGMLSREAVPADTYLISGEEADPKITWATGEYMYLNKGAAQGVKVGDEFLIMRPIKDEGKVKWFMWQPGLKRAMGQMWKDLGRVRVTLTQPNVSVVLVVYACDYMQRGDIARPFAERPAPPLKKTKFDPSAPDTGRPRAMVVLSRDFRQVVGTNDVVYINLGTAQGVKVGDYFRFFRYQGTRHQAPYQVGGLAYKTYEFGSAPVAYTKDTLPREVLGEGIVLRVTENAATVLVTYSVGEIFLGDYAELQEPQPIVEAKPPEPPPAPPPNRAPSIRCTAERSSVISGERVRITASASDPDGDRMVFSWRTNGGQIVGSGTAVQLDTSGLAPGRYTVTGRVDDARGAANDCAVNIAVTAPPPPPQASKANECIFRAASARVDNVCKHILDDVALRLKNEPDASVVLVGYADPAEPSPARLASQRAENAQQYLLTQGIAQGRVSVRAASGQVGAGRQNQRIDIVWVPAGATF